MDRSVEISAWNSTGHLQQLYGESLRHFRLFFLWLINFQLLSSLYWTQLHFLLLTKITEQSLLVSVHFLWLCVFLTLQTMWQQVSSTFKNVNVFNITWIDNILDWYERECAKFFMHIIVNRFKYCITFKYAWPEREVYKKDIRKSSCMDFTEMHWYVTNQLEVYKYISSQLQSH